MAIADLKRFPHAAVGSVDEVCEELVRRREEYGFSYITVGDAHLDAYLPIVERLSGHMTHEYELAHLSMIAVPPARLAGVARDAGYQYTGFRLTPSPSTGIDHRVLGNDRALEALRRAVDDAGIAILDVEVIRMKDPSAVEAARPLLEAAQALGARYVIATVEDDDPVRRVETLARMAELAAEHGTGIAVEFMLFSAARDLGTCVGIVQEAGAAERGRSWPTPSTSSGRAATPTTCAGTRRPCSPTRRSAVPRALARPPTPTPLGPRGSGRGSCRTRATCR